MTRTKYTRCKRSGCQCRRGAATTDTACARCHCWMYFLDPGYGPKGRHCWWCARTLSDRQPWKVAR